MSDTDSKALWKKEFRKRGILMAWRHSPEIHLRITTLCIIQCAQRHYAEWCNKVGRNREPLIWRWKRVWGVYNKKVLEPQASGIRVYILGAKLPHMFSLNSSWQRSLITVNLIISFGKWRTQERMGKLPPPPRNPRKFCKE